MEALFCFRQQFFCLMAAKIQGQPQKPRQLPGHIGPEFPQGPQQRRRRQQIQQHPRPGSQQQIQLGLAAAYPRQGPQGPQHHDPHGAARLAPLGPGGQLVPQQLPDSGGKLGGACAALGIGLQHSIALFPEIRRPAAGLAGVRLVHPVQHHQAGLPRRQFVHIRVPAGQGNARVQNFAHRIHILDFCRDHPPGLGHVPGEPAQIINLHIHHLLRILHNRMIIS